MKVLSLGWGVQSFTLAAMSALGEIERVDVALHSDTLHESYLTYQYAERMSTWLAERGVKVVTVKNPVNWDARLKEGQIFLPAYSLSEKGKKGSLLRTCTHRWKIVPMRRWLQVNRHGQRIEQWLGISTDEALRMKPSDVKYIENRFPLIELGMSRKDCVTWLENHGLEIPPRSSCTFCPYHNTAEWQRVKNTPHDWSEAVSVDRKLRKLRPPYDLFIHPARIPLEEVDLRTLEEKGQMRLWDEECTGLCGV